MTAATAGPIPACAGQPAKVGAGTTGGRAYPRVCGATDLDTQGNASFTGLSPRVRGNLAAGIPAAHPAGPIPACAGQPTKAALWAIVARAYPRVCGATVLPWRGLPVTKGLSPRVRGNRCFWRHADFHAGPIPACAGQPCWPVVNRLESGAYPRVCGATGYAQGWSAVRQGLSPRVRGNQYAERENHKGIGPIPACAGQPWFDDLDEDYIRAYPRVCGATPVWKLAPRGQAGLSPRVRGNRFLLASDPATVGPIPACAGQPRAPQA